MSAAVAMARPAASRRQACGAEALQELLEQGLTNEELARRFHCTPRTIMRAKSRLGLTSPHPRISRRFTDADRQRLAWMIADGWPISEIMATSGWEYKTVRRHSPTRPGWNREAVASFGASIARIREGAVRPDWLPRVSSKRR